MLGPRTPGTLKIAPKPKPDSTKAAPLEQKPDKKRKRGEKDDEPNISGKGKGKKKDSSKDKGKKTDDTKPVKEEDVQFSGTVAKALRKAEKAAE